MTAVLRALLCACVALTWAAGDRACAAAPAAAAADIDLTSFANGAWIVKRPPEYLDESLAHAGSTVHRVEALCRIYAVEHAGRVRMPG